MKQILGAIVGVVVVFAIIGGILWALFSINKDNTISDARQSILDNIEYHTICFGKDSEGKEISDLCSRFKPFYVGK